MDPMQLWDEIMAENAGSSPTRDDEEDRLNESVSTTPAASKANDSTASTSAHDLQNVREVSVV